MAIQVTIIKQPLYGKVVWDGIDFIYTPNAGYVGKDFYIYNIINEDNSTNTITNYTDTVNNPILAQDINVTIGPDQLIIINLDDYITDDGLMGPYSIKSISTPSFGSISHEENIIKYISNGYDGIDQIYYTVTDGQYNSTGLLTVNVTNGSDIPVPTYIQDQLLVSEKILSDIQGLSGNWESTYTILCAHSSTWNSLDPVRYDAVSTVVESNSSNWTDLYNSKDSYDQTYSIVESHSADWDYVYNNISEISSILSTNSANWIDAYNLLNTSSSSWNETTTNLSSITDIFVSNSANWIDAYDLMVSQSGVWDKTYYINLLSSNSGNWESGYNSLQSASSTWNDNTNTINSLTSLYQSDSANWNSSYLTVCAFSAGWGDLFALSILSTTSAAWNAVADSKPLYDQTYSIVDSTSSDWNYVKDNFYNTYNILTTTSSNWDTSYNAVCSNSAIWNEAFNNLQSLSTNYLENSANWDSIYNLVYSESSNWESILAFNDLLSSVSGNWDFAYNTVSANSDDWNSTYSLITALTTDYYANSDNWQTSYSIVCGNSATWSDYTGYNIISTNSGAWVDLLSAKIDYDNAVTVLCSHSGDWDVVYNSYTPLLNLITNQSGNWDTSYTIICSNSSTWNEAFNNIELLSTNFSDNSSNWDSAYNTVCAQSSNWEDTHAFSDLLSSVSGNWDSAYNTVSIYSGDWDSTYSIITSLSTDYYANSGDWDTSYSIVCGNSAAWSDYSGYNIISANSGTWTDLLSAKIDYDNAVTILCSHSGDWDVVYNGFGPISSLVDQQSANWDSAYSLVSSQSSTWDNLANNVNSLSSSYSSSSANWENTYNIVQVNSTYWDNSVLIDIVNDKYVDWNSSYNTLCANSGSWEASKTDLNNLTNSYNLSAPSWNSYYSVVTAGSGSWGDPTAFNFLAAQSGYYDSTYSLVCAQSTTWNNVSSVYSKYDTTYSYVTANSSNFADSYNIVNSSSSNWNSTNSIIAGNSARWLHGDLNLDFTAKDLIVSGNAIFFGSLTAAGTTTQLNTNVVATSAFSLENVGTVDAFTVSKTTSTGALANFSSNGNTVLYVDPNNKVGINTSAPNEALTVVGNISASGNVYGKTSDIYTTFQTKSGNYEIAYTYVNTNSGTITQLLTTSKPTYDTTYTYVTGVSSSITNFLTATKPSLDSAYSVVTAQSASVDTSYTFLTANSGKIGTDTVYRANSANYESAYTWVSTNSGATGSTAQINVIFDGGGQSVATGDYVIIQIPSKIQILNWTLLADVEHTTTYVDVLCGDYNSYPTFPVSITPSSSNSEYSKIVSAQKAPTLQNLSLSSWNTIIDADSLLKFNVSVNTLATVLTLSIKCQKI